MSISTTNHADNDRVVACVKIRFSNGIIEIVKNQVELLSKDGAKMAKDGTRRGGARLGAGRKPKRLSVREVETIMHETRVSREEYEQYPPCGELLQGTTAEDIYYSIYKFADQRGARDDLAQEIVEFFAVSYYRWAEAEKELNEQGLTAPHPVTRLPCKNPLVNVSETYSKQAQNYWYIIWSVLKEHIPIADEYDPMEDLLD